ncbi:c-type cytochrome [Vibrio sp. S9_S30]|nr:c-type cytochrome [Vibrio sp. S9_S30]MBD1555978.1 c-type cytochrome [Vibrio sp. S9_S30]
MRNVTIGCAMVLMMVFSGVSVAGDANAGKAKAAVCAACHGAGGIAAIDGYPNLKGQNEKYLVSALKAYKANQRTGGLAAVMSAQAMALSDEDIDNLAAYYSSLK